MRSNGEGAEDLPRLAVHADPCFKTALSTSRHTHSQHGLTRRRSRSENSRSRPVDPTSLSDPRAYTYGSPEPSHSGRTGCGGYASSTRSQSSSPTTPY